MCGLCTVAAAGAGEAAAAAPAKVAVKAADAAAAGLATAAAAGAGAVAGVAMPCRSRLQAQPTACRRSSDRAGPQLSLAAADLFSLGDASESVVAARALPRITGPSTPPCHENDDNQSRATALHLSKPSSLSLFAGLWFVT